MLRKSNNKLAFILKQVRSAGTLYGGGATQQSVAHQQSLSRPMPPAAPPAQRAQAQAAIYRGHFDEGRAISLSAPQYANEFSQETQIVSLSLPVENDFDLDFGQPEILRVGHGFSNAASVQNGSDKLERVQRVPNENYSEYSETGLEDLDEEDFDEDLDAILSSPPPKAASHQHPHHQGSSQQFSQEPLPPVAPPAPKTFEQPSGHSLFDKMAQGMEYATTFDVGSVNLSKVFDQFDTAMEVQEMTRTPLKRKDDSQDMAEMFSQFDRQMTEEKTPVDPIKRVPTWRPSRSTITHFEDLVNSMGPSLYLLEKCPAFKEEILDAFDTGIYKDIPLDFVSYIDPTMDRGAGYGIIQVRLDGNWVGLITEGLSLANRTINWNDDIRIQIGINTHVAGKNLGVGDRINTLVHELALHGLSHANLIRTFREGNRSIEDLRVEYVKRILLETDHLSIEGTHFPKNQLYTSINSRILQRLKGNSDWKEFGKIEPRIYSDFPEIDRELRNIKHDQSSTPPQVPIWFQFLVATVFERDRVYVASNSQSFYGVRYHEVKPAEVDRLYRSATEAEVREWHAKYQK